MHYFDTHFIGLAIFPVLFQLQKCKDVLLFATLEMYLGMEDVTLASRTM